MKTLETETDQELLKGFQEYQREQQRTPEPLYHPIGSGSHTQRIETQEGWKECMVSLDPTFFITFLFHRRFSNQNIDQIITYGEKKIRMFHKYIHKKVMGKYWYKPEMVNPQEHIVMVLFPQDIKTNLHYHGGVVIKNSKMFPNKIQMFQEHSNRIWNTNKKLSTGGRDVLVPNGSVDIQTPECDERVSRYSTRKHDCYENHEHHIIL